MPAAGFCREATTGALGAIFGGHDLFVFLMIGVPILIFLL